MEPIIWIGIALCLSQSATFSGLNLALFGVSRLRLEIEVAGGNRAARKLLRLRKDSNFLLATILWGNVGVNCLLTLLSDSVLAGVTAFFFSTFLITILGEIIPQAYFSRHALTVASVMVPLLKIYQFVLYPIARPTAMLLNAWLGPEGVQYYREQDIHELLKKHVVAKESDVGQIEALGAMNFLAFDDLQIGQEGEIVDPKSIVSLPVEKGLPVFPKIEEIASDSFVHTIQSSGRKWVIITDAEENPLLALNANAFIRGALFLKSHFNPYAYCHRPLVVRDAAVHFSRILPQLKVQPTSAEDDVIDHDIILLWGNERRIITGADILGRLLRGIVKVAA